jgi:hypothetical protein
MTTVTAPAVGDVVVYKNFLGEKVRGCVQHVDTFHQEFSLITETEGLVWGRVSQLVENQGPLR